MGDQVQPGGIEIYQPLLRCWMTWRCDEGLEMPGPRDGASGKRSAGLLRDAVNVLGDAITGTG